jgi:stage V sporulation protein B
MKKLSFLQNAVVLVTSNLITGALGFLFSVILSKEVGAHGVGLYSMVMPVYSFFICITCGGTTTALSKITAEKNSQHNYKDLYRTVTCALAFFTFWTAFISILSVLSAPYISTEILKDARTYLPILSFVPALIFLSAGSVLKGYFYGMQNSTFPAVIDITEKCVRLVVLIVLVTRFKALGLKYQIAGAVLAMSAGELTSTALLYSFYKKSYLNFGHLAGKPDNVPQIIANILSTSLPICLNGVFSTAAGSFIAAMVPRRLYAAGFAAETSLALFGKVAGMGMNIVMFPSIAIGAISTLLVPAISEASAAGSSLGINKRIYSTIRITTLIAALSGGLFFELPDELGKLFYNRADLGNIIFSLSFGVIFVYVESTLCGILNGLGKQKILLRNTFIMSAIDIAVLYTFLGIPSINIYGYAIDFVISPLVGCIMNYSEIRRATNVKISIPEIIICPIFLTGCNIIFLKTIKPFVFNILKSQNVAISVLLLTGILSYWAFYLILSPLFKPGCNSRDTKKLAKRRSNFFF